jgi:hypothetical protein
LKRKVARKMPKFEAICRMERLPGSVHEFVGFICYVPEKKYGQFKRGDIVRVTVERLTPGGKGFLATTNREQRALPVDERVTMIPRLPDEK